MVYNPDLTQAKERIIAIAVDGLTPAQLEAVQDKFGTGANLRSPNPAEELFVHDKREWTSYTHPDLKRAMPEANPLVVIDSQTPDDGGIWYIDRFANQQDVDVGEAENTDTLYKLRMKIEDIVVSYLILCSLLVGSD